MAVLVSNGPTSLSTVNGWYRAEAFNLGMFSTTDLALSTTRTIAVTFANAGACQGLILALVASATTATLKSVVVTLQENVATVWTDRATVTLSAATIANNVTTATSEGWLVPFTGGTFPYTVTTAAGTWRFQVSQTGAQANNWSIRTSDATNPFYVTWCNNALTFASNDCIVCKDVVTIDQTATLKGVLGTGDTTRSVCAVICRSTTPAPSTVANLVWANPPAAAYTLTIDGLMILGSHSGFRIGTAAAPIAAATAATVDMISATSGTAANTGISTVEHSATVRANNNRQSLFFYGAYRTPLYGVLSASAATGQPNITTTTSTGWSTGDRLAVGGYTTRGTGEGSIYTINTIAGASIGLTSNLVTVARSAQGRVVNLSQFGVALKATSSLNLKLPISQPNNFQMRGVLQQYFCWDNAYYPSAYVQCESANVEPVSITFSAFELASSQSFNTGGLVLDFWTMHHLGTSITDNVFANALMGNNVQLTGVDSSTFAFDRNVVVRPGSQGAGAFTLTSSAGFSGKLRDNAFDGGNQPLLDIAGVNCTITGNRIWGNSSSTGSLRLGSVLTSTLGANVLENCAVGMQFNQSVAGCIDTDSVFGQEVANGTDIAITQGTYANTTIISPTGNLTIGTGNNIFSNAIAGTHLRIADFNSTTNDDRGSLRNGSYQRTGSGLSDTTARTAGGFALRLAPNSGTNSLAWPNLVSERAVPTGNIQSKTMTVTAWVYINNAAFYAGTHTQPTLSVKYDNATTATAVAAASAGAWQQLAVTFTPATTYGQIEVWISGATDATGANAYFYVDDLQVAYPAGVAINLGGLDLWANATPVWPPIATFPSLGSVWDEPEAAHVVAGSYGERVTRALADPESGYSLPRVQRIVAAAVAGKTSGGPGGFTARNLTDTQDQVIGTADGVTGDRVPTSYGS